MSIHGDHEQEVSRPQPMLTAQQQEELSRAISESMANFALVVPPVLAQFRLLAQTALPALAAALKPFMQALKDMDLQPGELEGMALAEEMSQGSFCRRCNPPRLVAPGFMGSHQRAVHGKKDPE